MTIQRDSAYGIPHIYGDTRSDTMFGAGYAGAADRLFLMDVLRHTGRAELASFLGGSNASTDAGQWGFSPYTEADLEKQLTQTPQIYGQAGQQAVEDVQSYVDGINAYIAAANADPKDLKPAEYTLLGKPMEPWKSTDVIAIASLVGGIFGRGGGNELNSALTMQAFVDRMGTKAGRKAWLGFRSKNDPEAPTTVSRAFPYETRSAFAKKGLALPDPGSVKETSTATASSAPSVGGDGIASVGARLKASLEAAGHASNWEMVSAAHSATGHPIGVLGPQVGYYVPQILMEEDLHGPGIDARGAAFAGVNLYVLLGHGRDYAWSATTATSDNVDTFAEVLCKDSLHYQYKGKCLAMEKLEKTESWAPNTIDPTPAGSQTLVAYRTVHGDRLRPRQGQGQEGRLRPRAQHLLPRGRLGDRLRAAERTGIPQERLAVQEGGLAHQLPLQLGLPRLRRTSPTGCRGRCRSGPRGPRRTSRSSAPASTTGRASTRRPSWPTTCRSPSTRRRSTRPTSSPGTTSRRRNGPRPTTSTPTGRCSASR